MLEAGGRGGEAGRGKARRVSRKGSGRDGGKEINGVWSSWRRQRQGRWSEPEKDRGVESLRARETEREGQRITKRVRQRGTGDIEREEPKVCQRRR